VSVFVTGTDTNVGKTYFTSLYTRALRSSGIDAVALKPVCSGPRDDAILLAEASGGVPVDDINPIWLQAPAAPSVAAEIEGRSIDFDFLRDWYGKMSARHECVVVEGAGGWLVPLNGPQTIADLAVLFGLPVVVVVANRLGCINHTLLTLESIAARHLKCAGLVLNTIDIQDDIATATNRSTLARASDVPVIFEVKPNQKLLSIA
jgi:dethiobiotin synthetase